jgi:4-amino-4-deoxy-L-arabinose transferase-like glycosyltransferase
MPRRLLGWPALALAGVLFFWYFATSTAEAPVGDAYEPFLGAIRMIRGRGLPESKVMPGQTFLLVPTAIVSKWVVDGVPDESRRFALLILVTALFPAALTAGTAGFLFRAARTIGHSTRSALFTALVFALATPAAVYAKNFFPQTAEAFFLLACVWSLLVARSKLDAGARTPLVLSGLAYGALLLVKAIGLVYLPALAAFVWFMRRDGFGLRRLAWWCVPALALALLYLPYNRATHGGAFDFGYGLERDAYWGFSTNTLVGLYGLLLSPGKGIFFYAPVLVLAAPGAVRLFRRDPAAAGLFLGAACGALFLHAHWWAWHGDNAWGPRYLVPALPLLVLLASETWSPAAQARVRKRARVAAAAALGALVALSIGVQALGASFTNNAYQTMTYDTVIPQYRPEMGALGPRDDELHLHWIPEFSPIAGHLWLARHALRNDSASAYLADYPWRALRPDGAWAPSVTDPPPPLDYWLLRLPRTYASAAGLVRLLAAALFVLLAASVSWLALSLRRAAHSDRRRESA